ncbi:MAG: AIR synthase-related protein, partial [bacterium]|nr:AIR synthase-related protein [bacterium]
MDKPIDLYAKDGVNVSESDAFSAFAAREAATTFSPFIKVRDWAKGHFRGPRTFMCVGLPADVEFDVAADGIGTKVNFVNEAFSHFQAGANVQAMCFGDITRWGGKPLLFSNVLDVSTLGERDTETNRLFRRAIVGLCSVAREQQVLVYRGETAELGVCVGADNPDAITKFNWAGFALGAYDPKRMITGEKMQNGDVVVALRERSPRSNGYSSIRKAFELRFGKEWWKNPEAKLSIKAAAIPCTLYDRFLAKMNGWESLAFKPVHDVHGIAHITGGGIPGKFAKDILFPLGLSSELLDLWKPPSVVKESVEWRGMSDREAYKTFGAGQGALVVVPAEQSDSFIYHARVDGIEAQSCGRVIAANGTPSLRIRSKFLGAD